MTEAETQLVTFVDTVTQMIAEGGQDEAVRRLLLKAQVQLLLLQSLFGTIDPNDAEWMRSVYTTLGGLDNE